MALDLLGLFFDPEKPNPSMATAWLVCQRCLHGRMAWHLRCYVSHWNPEPRDEVWARQLKQRIIEYHEQLRMESSAKRAPAWTHLGPSARHEMRKQFLRLRGLLSREIADDEADECRLDRTNPPGFECLSNEF